MKVVTICGSMRFAHQMQETARILEATQRYCVVQCVYNPKKRKETWEENNNLTEAHFKKIDIADAVYVMNIGGYIGEATKEEIEYAKKQGKEIIYHEPLEEEKISKKKTKTSKSKTDKKEKTTKTKTEEKSKITKPKAKKPAKKPSK